MRGGMAMVNYPVSCPFGRHNLLAKRDIHVLIPMLHMQVKLHGTSGIRFNMKPQPRPATISSLQRLAIQWMRMNERLSVRAKAYQVGERAHDRLQICHRISLPIRNNYFNDGRFAVSKGFGDFPVKHQVASLRVLFYTHFRRNIAS